MKMRKVVSILLVAAMTIGMVTGCGSSSDKKTAKSDAKGKVYYLNFKPEQDEQWQELAEQYTDETGVPVTVLTAASGEYEKTLKSEMAKTAFGRGLIASRFFIAALPAAALRSSAYSTAAKSSPCCCSTS